MKSINSLSQSFVRFKVLALVSFSFAYLQLGFSASAGTITVSATGLSSSPIFVTSSLGSLSVGTELNIGTFLNTANLTSTISAFKTGVEGIGNTLAEAQTDATAKKSALYTTTLNWLSSSSNFTSIVAAASAITQTGTTASGKFLFNNSATRTVNGASGSYAGANGTFDVTYTTYGPGTGAKLWAWYATGTEIAIVTDSTWVVPTNNTSGLTIGSANLQSTGAGDAAELLLASYTDYSGIDLISSRAISQTLTVIPEPSTGGLVIMSLGLLGIFYRLKLGKLSATFKSSTAGLSLLSIVTISNAQTVSTPIVGFNTLNFSSGNSLSAATFVKSNIFQGAATSKTTNSLTVSSANFGSLGPVSGLPTHYVKITSGAMEGYVLDILSNTSTSVTVDGSLADSGATPSFVVRPHVKASDLFSGNTSLSAGLDTLTLFNDNGTSTVLLWVGSDSPTGWVDVATEAPVDGVVYPGQGFLLTTNGSGSFKFQGTVETTPTVVPLYPGAVNLVTRGSPGTAGLALQSSGLGQNMSPGLDTVQFLSADGQLSSQSVYIWAGAPDGFVDVVSEAPASLSIGSAQILNVTVVTPTAWKATPPINP